MEPTNGAYFVEFRPTIWQRICWWSKWPWSVRPVPHDARRWGTQPYLVEVRENEITIGWHPVDSSEAVTVLIPNRWASLVSLIKPRRYEVRIGRDPDWRETEADDAR